MSHVSGATGSGWVGNVSGIISAGLSLLFYSFDYSETVLNQTSM
jgi:hypothetical protein